MSELGSLGKVTDERFMRELLGREVLGRRENEVVLRCEVRKLRSSLRKTIVQYVVHFRGRSTRIYIGVHRESDERLERGYLERREILDDEKIVDVKGFQCNFVAPDLSA